MAAAGSRQTANIRKVVIHTRLLSFAFCLLPFVFLFQSACLLKHNYPSLPRNYPVHNTLNHKGRNPVIVIPGVLGSQLVNRHTGEKVWPTIGDAKDDTLALPITAPLLAENTDNLIASEILETARFGRLIPEISVYDKLIEALEKFGGYRRGNLTAPEAGGDQDTYYVFAYDWRRDNVESARLLARSIAVCKEKLGAPDLRFDIIAHSMGGLVARYYAMYGDRDVNETGMPQPDWSGAHNLNRLILMGTPNAGSLDAFRTLVLGYSITGTNRRHFALLSQLNRDSIFTTPSVYQLLPRNADARFLDVELSPLKLDLFALETWRQYRWSAAFNVELPRSVRKRLVKKAGDKEAGVVAVKQETEKIAAERERFLRQVLARAAAFHRALDADGPPPAALRLYLYGGDCEDTLDAVLIVPHKKTGEPLTLFRPDGNVGNRKVRRRAYKAMFVPGDTRVTRRSLFGLRSEPDLPNDGNGSLHAMKLSPFSVLFDCELHGDLPLNPRVQNNLLTMLLGNSF